MKLGIRPKINRLGRIGGHVVVLSLLCLTPLDLAAKAVRFRDGTVHFAGVPVLGKVSTTNNQSWGWGATYFFTLQVPADASEPLGRVDIQQREGLDSIDFNLKQTYAYKDGDRRQRLEVEATATAKDTLTVTFDPPVPPGTAITLGLSPYNNPRTSGVYLFGVTAFPAGEQVSSQFIGHGRLQFYDRTFRDRWFGGW